MWVLGWPVTSAYLLSLWILVYCKRVTHQSYPEINDRVNWNLLSSFFEPPFLFKAKNKTWKARNCKEDPVQALVFHKENGQPCLLYCNTIWVLVGSFFFFGGGGLSNKCKNLISPYPCNPISLSGQLLTGHHNSSYFQPYWSPGLGQTEEAKRWGRKK